MMLQVPHSRTPRGRVTLPRAHVEPNSLLSHPRSVQYQSSPTHCSYTCHSTSWMANHDPIQPMYELICGLNEVTHFVEPKLFQILPIIIINQVSWFLEKCSANSIKWPVRMVMTISQKNPRCTAPAQEGLRVQPTNVVLTAERHLGNAPSPFLCNMPLRIRWWMVNSFWWQPYLPRVSLPL